MENLENERVLSVAALGRPFRLGMLYDSRTEKLVPDITLWDQPTLENRAVHQIKRSDFHVLCSDSLGNKASALDMDASLRLSFLSGLVHVDGAANYLQHKKSSRQEQSITLQYNCTTREESLAMEQLGQRNVQHPEIFDHVKATHVVTSIVFGAQAFFTFVRKLSSVNTHRNTDGNVYAIIGIIPTIKINRRGEMVNMSEDEMKLTEEFVCRYFGDFQLSHSPSSFLDVVKAYQELPSLLGTEGEHAVPVKVKLYPLALIDSRATRLVRDIDVDLVTKIENNFEQMYELSLQCSDVLHSNAAKKFPDLKGQIEEFKKITENCKKRIKTELCEMLPRIRSGEDEERCLVELLNKMNQSPVSSDALRSWLQAKNTQTKVLNNYVSAMPAGIKYATKPGDLESEVTSPGNTYTLCLTISVPSNVSQLEAMKRYCAEEQLPDNYDTADHTVTTQQINSRPMKKVADEFRNFYNANKTKEGISFIVAQEFSECDTFHARVKCYKNGRLMSDDYQLPSAPEKVEALVEDTTHNSVTISWSPPKYGVLAITSYVVSCCKDSTEHVASRVTIDRDEDKVTIPGLAANTEYVVRVWGTCEVGDGPVGDAKVMVTTKPAASQPEMLRAMKVSPTEVLLEWQAPACVAEGCSVEQYVIKQETKAGYWEERFRVPSSEVSFKVEVLPNTVHSFRVAASCGSDGLGCVSEPCTIDLTKPKPTTYGNLKQHIRDCSVVIPGNAHVYVPQLRLVLSNPEDKIDKYEFGSRKFNVPEKVIMLVGATGSGKTTLINGLVNYIFGVEWEDSFRFKMILEPNVANQAKSQTTKVTSYTLHHQESFKVPYTLTIVDTPGFGDVSGIMRDKEITENIRKFFTTAGENGITHIDAVGFVANSSLPRLTPTQRYIFDQILSLFGKDIADNIFLLLTFADGNKPQVLSGIKEAKIPYKKHFKFNNSALYVLHDVGCRSTEDDGDEGDETFNKIVWEMGAKSFVHFLEQLNFVESKTLILTKKVLDERNKLHAYIAGIQTDIRQGLSTLDSLKQSIDILENHQADIERHKDFKYEVEEEVFVRVPVDGSKQNTTNCSECYRTCHDNCIIGNDKMKYWCYVMSWGGYCSICPNKCHWSLHKNTAFKYELKLQKTEKTVSELRQRYEEATQGKLSAENLIQVMKDEFEAAQLKVLAMTDSVRKSIQRLEKIALRPSPMTTVQYLEVLIEDEKNRAEPGWKARLEQLNNLKKEAECMEKIADKNYDPFKEHLQKWKLKLRKSKNSIVAKIIDYVETLCKE